MRKLLIRAAVAAVRKITSIPPNRVVAALTPLVAPVAGWVAAWVPQHFPGVGLHPSEGVLLGLFATGSLSAVTAAWQWLKGWQAHEARAAAPAAKPRAKKTES